MQCKYCVADQGVYKSNNRESTINIETLGTVITKLIAKYPEGIQYIQFFGGEPLLVFDKIVEVHKVINGIFRKAKIDLPQYSIVTNGTLINDVVAEFINDNKIRVTISLDGTEMTHDANRIMYDGKGSYDTIIQGINKIDKRLLIVEFSISNALVRNYQKGMIKEILNNYISLGFKNIVFNIIYSDETIIACNENEEKYHDLLAELCEVKS